MTGRMTYRGKVMNRAARIASTASTGQVLCSSDSWQLAMTADSQVGGNWGEDGARLAGTQNGNIEPDSKWASEWPWSGPRALTMVTALQ